MLSDLFKTDPLQNFIWLFSRECIDLSKHRQTWPPWFYCNGQPAGAATFQKKCQRFVQVALLQFSIMLHHGTLRLTGSWKKVSLFSASNTHKRKFPSYARKKGVKMSSIRSASRSVGTSAYGVERQDDCLILAPLYFQFFFLRYPNSVWS